MAESIPALAAADVAHAISLIQAAYAPAASTDLPALQSLQSALLAMQRTPAAWGLIVPLLAHEDANVQFFGAHTAHAKIARGELASLPETEQIALRDALVGLAGVQGRSRVVRRKLYGALTALALRLVPPPGPGRQSAWEGWVEGTVASLAGAGAPSEHIHEFLAGAAEDVGAANLLPQHRIQLDESLRSAAPLVLQSVSAVLSNPSSNDASLPAALTCLIAWLPNKLLPDMEVARLVPPLISLLGSSNSTGDDSDTGTEAARQALSELLARPPAGWSPAVLLEPLLLWAASTFPEYAPPPPGSSQLSTAFPNSGYPTPPSSQQSSFAGPSSATSSPYADLLSPNYALPPLSSIPAQKQKLKTHTKLLVALAEAGVEWVAGHVVDFTTVSPSPASPGTPRAALAQTLLRLVLALTAADPGGARVRLVSASGGYEVQNESGDGGEGEEDDEDEEAEGGAPLGFWYLLQEALWEIPVANAYLFPSASGISSPMVSPGGMDADDPDRFRRGSPWTPASPPAFSHSTSFGFPASSSATAPPLGASSSSFRGSPSPFGGNAQDREDEAKSGPSEAEKARTAHARAAYVSLVRVLRAKTVCGRGGWGRDRLERFGVYRRDVGDTVVNA